MACGGVVATQLEITVGEAYQVPGQITCQGVGPESSERGVLEQHQRGVDIAVQFLQVRQPRRGCGPGLQEGERLVRGRRRPVAPERHVRVTCRHQGFAVLGLLVEDRLDQLQRERELVLGCKCRREAQLGIPVVGR